MTDHKQNAKMGSKDSWENSNMLCDGGDTEHLQGVEYFHTTNLGVKQFLCFPITDPNFYIKHYNVL